MFNQLSRCPLIQSRWHVKLILTLHSLTEESLLSLILCMISPQKQQEKNKTKKYSNKQKKPCAWVRSAGQPDKWFLPVMLLAHDLIAMQSEDLLKTFIWLKWNETNISNNKDKLRVTHIKHPGEMFGESVHHFVHDFECLSFSKHFYK
jgi:hypothetical protein